MQDPMHHNLPVSGGTAWMYQRQLVATLVVWRGTRYMPRSAPRQAPWTQSPPQVSCTGQRSWSLDTEDILSLHTQNTGFCWPSLGLITTQHKMLLLSSKCRWCGLAWLFCLRACITIYENEHIISVGKHHCWAIIPKPRPLYWFTFAAFLKYRN